MSNTLQVDLDLIRKYDVPGPRYTSYPTAVQFTDTFSREVLLADIEVGNREHTPLSLYFHLPFCETLCWFCGCTTVISGDHSRADRYLDYLEKELNLTAPLINEERRAAQLHFGGGTPNFLSPAQIDRLGALIHDRFQFEDGAEISVEIDPRRLTREHIEAFRRMGVTRASFGIQDFNPAVQKAVNRIQPKELSDQAAAWIREAGFDSLNLDLIYGLPHQTPESFADTIEQALDLKPDRFAVFNYAHVPWMKPAQKLVARAVLPSPETKLSMLKIVIETLSSSGYVYIGMDHFAREDDELARAQRAGTLQRNFQGYSTRGGTDIFAFGMSSISQTTSHYRQNEKSLPAYYERLDREELPVSRALLLNDEDKLRRTVIMRLMCDLAFDFESMSRNLGVDFREHFAGEIAALEELSEDGLVRLSPNGLQVTESGRLLLRNLAMIFDQHLHGKHARFSRTV